MSRSTIKSVASSGGAGPSVKPLSRPVIARRSPARPGRRARGLSIALALLLVFPLVAHADWTPSESAEPELASACWPDVLFSPPLIASLPPGRYLYSETYGWFDPQHFRTGDPARVIEDTSRAITAGGGFVTIEQGVRGGITGYAARYWISGDLTQEDVLSTALGIYLDWSVRFEAWQGEPPRSIAAPRTSFAIEDLPSQYLGFFAAAHGLDCADVVACLLGPVEGSEDAPPHLVFWDPRADLDSPELIGVRRVVNVEFTPKVPTDEAWINIPWPEPMHMEPAEPGHQCWLFVDDATWYFSP